MWSEPSVVEAVAYEFAETEQFIAAAESILDEPYAWGVYDILCLPPSFPYGGMENPCITFVTPTLLARDRSLADVVAHEIAHSWTGNLVTNHTWEHFWLNEGWTMWVQRKIMCRCTETTASSTSTRRRAGRRSWTRWRTSATTPMASRWSPRCRTWTRRRLQLRAVRRGFNLLFELTKVGGGGGGGGGVDHAPFEAFARAYIARFKFKTVTSGEFRAFFEEYFGTGPGARAWSWTGRWTGTHGSTARACRRSRQRAARRRALRIARAPQSDCRRRWLRRASAGDLQGWGST